MSHDRIDGVPQGALSGSMRDFRIPAGPDLLARTRAFYDWQDTRRQSGTWPFSRATEAGPATSCAIRDDRGQLSQGVNFASQDYLSLSAHPAVRAAAKDAIDTMGVHSAGSPALVGNTSTSVALERRIADLLCMREAILFPTGWAAGFGVIKGLVREKDHIVMDALSHACLQVGAQAATPNVATFRHLDLDHCRRRLAAIRARDPQAGIMLVTEGLFSMDSDTPDLAAMQSLAREYGATLMVDVAHDLGNLGPRGTGHIGLQNMLGQVDLVMGSFSKTFGANGGFVAVNDRAVKEYLRFYSPSCTFSNALSPAQVAAVTAALPFVVTERWTAYPLYVAIMGLFAMRMAPLQALLTALVPSRQRGAFLSLTIALGQIGTGLGASLGGALYAGFGYEANAFVSAALILAMAALVWWRLPEPTEQATDPEAVAA